MDTATDFDALVGRNLRALRRAAGLSQMALAAGVEQQGVTFGQNAESRVERGVRPLRLEEALAAATHLGVPVEALADPETAQRVKVHALTPAAAGTLTAEDFRALEARVDELTRALRAATQPMLV